MLEAFYITEFRAKINEKRREEKKVELKSFFLLPSARSTSKAPHRTRERRGCESVCSSRALPLVVRSRSAFEAAREHRLGSKWDLFSPIEDCRKDAILSLPPKHSAESHALVKEVLDRMRTCSCR